MYLDHEDGDSPSPAGQSRRNFGGHEYAGAIDQIFHGWIGDVRIVNRPLSRGKFMTGR
jgi:hypothetical protein